MNRVLRPSERCGSVTIPASKSQAHRLLIVSAFSDAPVSIHCDGLSNDIKATADCLNAIGANITLSDTGCFDVKPIENVTGVRELHCGESGSTLRFMLPVCGALGISSVFIREGRLPERPLEPLLSELKKHGMQFSEDGALLYVSGKLSSGNYTLPGNISSQYITGLLFALPFLDGDSILNITGNVESGAYITMTEQALTAGGISFEKSGNTYTVKGNQTCHMPSDMTVESDWSNAAFFLSIGALSEKGLHVNGLNPDSAQGDKAVIDILKNFGAEVTMSSNSINIKKGHLSGQIIDAAPIPDLVPVLSVVASVCEGETRFVNAGRLRLKESDRLESTAALINALGGTAKAAGDELIITGVSRLHGGTVESCNDHRIAMSAAVAACISNSDVTVTESDCVKKSYPRFWDDFNLLTEVHP